MVAAAIIGGAVVGGLATAYAGNQSADAQSGAAAQSNATQLQIYNQNREDFAPWRQAGIGALAQLTAPYGISIDTPGNQTRVSYPGPPPGPTTGTPVDPMAPKNWMNTARPQNALVDQAPRRGGWMDVVRNSIPQNQMPAPNTPVDPNAPKIGAASSPLNPLGGGFRGRLWDHRMNDGRGIDNDGVSAMRPGDPTGRRVVENGGAPTATQPTGSNPAAPPPTNLPPGADPRWAAFYNSPDYGFAFDEGMRGLLASQGSRGNTLGGGALREITRYGQGIASQQYGNYFNRLSSIAGLGQTATQSLASSGSNYANQVGANNHLAANARASAYQNNANAFNNTLNTGMNVWGMYQAGQFNNGGG